MVNMKRSILAYCLLLAVLAPIVCAQRTQAPPIQTSQINLPVFTPNFAPVTSASVNIVGNPGPGTYYYWIVSQFLLGPSQPQGPFVANNAPNPISSSNYIQIFPQYVPGVLSIDVLKTSSPVAPSGNCACALLIGITPGSTINDQGATTLAYNVAALDPNAFALTLQNEVQGNSSSHLILRQNNAFIADLSANTNTQSSTPYLADGVNTTLQAVYQKPGFAGGQINFSLAAGSTLTDITDFYLNTAQLGAPTISNTTVGCSGVFGAANTLTLGQNLTVFVEQFDFPGDAIYSAPVQMPVTLATSCFLETQNNSWVWEGQAANNGAQGWFAVFALECATPCPLNNNGNSSTPPVTGATLQFSSNSGGSWAWGIDSATRTFAYTKATSTLSFANCVYQNATNCPTGIHPAAGDNGLEVNNVTINANTNGGTLIHCGVTVPANAKFFGLNRQATYLELGQSCPNGIPSVAVSNANLVTSGSQTGTIGNILTVVEAFSESGATQSEAIFEYTYPLAIGPFLSGARNAQIIAPAPPLTKQAAVPLTNYIVGDRVTDNNTTPAIWIATISGVSGTGTFSPTCSIPGTTLATYGSVTFKCLANPGTYVTGSHAYPAQAEYYDPSTQSYLYNVTNASGVPAGCTGSASGTPVAPGIFGAIVVDNTCSWMWIDLNTTYQPTYQIYTASCSAASNSICLWSALKLNGSAGLVNFSGCSGVKDRNTNAVAIQSCPAGTAAVYLTFQGTGAGATITAPTLTGISCLTGFASRPNMPGNAVWGGYVYGTRNGISQWQGEGTVTLTAGQSLVINAPPVFAPMAEGWNPFACFTASCNFLETQQVPDGIHTICGDGSPSMYVQSMNHGEECSTAATTATIVDPQTAIPYAPQFNLTDAVWNGGGMTSNMSSYCVPLPINGATGSANGVLSCAGYGNEIGDFSEELGRTYNVKEPAGVFYQSINNQEEGSIASNVYVRDATGGCVHINGYAAQNSYLTSMHCGGIDVDSSFGIVIQDDISFRTIEDCSCSAWAQGTNWYSLFGIGVTSTPGATASYATIIGVEGEVTQHVVEFRGGTGVVIGATPSSRAGGRDQDTVHVDANSYDVVALGIKPALNTCAMAVDVKSNLCRQVPGAPIPGPYSFGDILGAANSLGRNPESGIAGASPTIGIPAQFTGLTANAAYQTIYLTGNYTGKGGAGTYRVCVDALTTTAGASSVAPSIDVSWNDGTSAVTASMANTFAVAWVLTSTSVGSQFSGCTQIHVGPNIAIAVGTGQITSGTYTNSPAYTIEINVEALQ